MRINGAITPLDVSITDNTATVEPNENRHSGLCEKADLESASPCEKTRQDNTPHMAPANNAWRLEQ